MATRLVLAIAANGEIRLVRQRGEQIKHAAVIGPRHFGTITPRKCRPLAGRMTRQGEFYGVRGRCEVRQPDVVPVARREPRLRNAARRPPHRPNSQSLARKSRRAQTHASDGHGWSRSYIYLNI